MRKGGKHREWFFHSQRGGLTFFLLLLIMSFLSLPQSLHADGIGGFIELNYSHNVTDTEDEAGETTRTISDNFNQLYNLSLSRTFTPTLFLNAGGIFEDKATRNGGDSGDSNFSVTSVRPFADLTLRTPVFTLGGNYHIRQEESKGSDIFPATDVNENYSAFIGWKPDGLPSVDMRYERAKIYDKERINRDSTTDTLSLSLRYVPEYERLKGLEIRYLPSYSKINNKLDNVITTDIAHNMRLTFSDLFFDRRVSVYASYNLAHAEKEIVTSSSTAEVSSQSFPFNGLSALSDAPENVVLTANSALIDGNLTAGAGIDIGLPGAGENKIPRNIGLDFVAGSEVNSILVWIDRELPAQIADSFSWDIYTSTNNEDWSLAASIPRADFGPFQNSFEINFSNVTARYVKVVTKPLEVGDTLGVPGDFSNILVTEIQAFLNRPAEELERRVKDTTTNQIYNLDVRTRILNVPALFYEFSYYKATAASSFSNYTMSNGFSASHIFSSIVTAQARVAREDSVLQEERGVSYLYNTSVTVRPLSTLTHTLNYSGVMQDLAGEKSSTNSLFLNNVAELYKGININVNGGLSFQRKDEGEETTNTIFSFGSGLVPHKRLTIDLYYTDTTTKQSGGDEEDASDFTRRGTVGISYKPFDTVYLFTSFETISTSEDTRDLQNYGANWSPFPDGSLQFTFSYNESLTSDEGKIRLINPSVRWNINRRTYVEFSAQLLRSEFESTLAESTVSSATFRTVF